MKKIAKTTSTIFAAETPADEETASALDEAPAAVKKSVKIIEILTACDNDGSLCRKFTVLCKNSVEALQAVNDYFVNENKMVVDVLSQMITGKKTDFKSSELFASVIRIRPFTFVVDILQFSLYAQKKVSEYLVTKSVAASKTEPVKYIPTISVRPEIDKMLSKFTTKTGSVAPVVEKTVTKRRREELSDEELQAILDASEKMREKIAQIDDFFKSAKFTNPYDEGGILDSKKWEKSTFTLERVKNGQKVIKTVKAYDCYKSEQYATRLAYQVTMLKIKAACGFYDKKATTRFDALTYKLYCQRAYLLRLVAAYDEGDIKSLCPLDGKNNVYTDVVVFDLFQEAITHIYTCMAEGLGVAEIYNSALNQLNKYVYKQSSHKGGIVTENGKQHRKYTLVSLDEIQAYISDAGSEELESGILPQLNDTDEEEYFTIVDGIQFDAKMRRDLYIHTRNKFLNACSEKKRLKYRKIFTAFCTGISNREIAKRLSDDKSCITEGGIRKIVKKIKQCGMDAFKELYPSLYDIFTNEDKKTKTDLGKILSRNSGVSNKPQITVSSEMGFIDYIIQKWNNVG